MNQERIRQLEEEYKQQLFKEQLDEINKPNEYEHE